MRRHHVQEEGSREKEPVGMGRQRSSQRHRPGPRTQGVSYRSSQVQTSVVPVSLNKFWRPDRPA